MPLNEISTEKKDACQADICNLRFSVLSLLKELLPLPPRWMHGEGCGNQFSETLRYVKLFKFLQIDYFQQLIQSHL